MGISAARLLNTWEVGLSLDANQRALHLLALVLPDVAPADLAVLSVGERDYHLLQLRQMLFGTQMVSLAHCPQCQEHLEWVSDTRILSSAGQGKYPLTAPLALRVDGLQVQFRLPGCGELVRLAATSGDGDDLLRQCVLNVVDETGANLLPAQLPATALSALSAAMQAADPLARVDISLDCPACGHHWLALFDIATFLWAEMQAWAGRTLRNVHLLARAYGWSEADILAMTPTRQQLYLGMLAA